MDAEKPAQGVMMHDEYSFVVGCACTNPDCQHHVHMNVDDEIDTVDIFVEWKNPCNQNRWKALWQLLTKGYVQMESSISLNKQTAKNYAATLDSFSKRPNVNKTVSN